MKLNLKQLHKILAAAQKQKLAVTKDVKGFGKWASKNPGRATALGAGAGLVGYGIGHVTARENPNNPGLAAIGHEMKVNPPKILGHTAHKFGAARAEKQRVAILLSKARRAGMRIPQA